MKILSTRVAIIVQVVGATTLQALGRFPWRPLMLKKRAMWFLLFSASVVHQSDLCWDVTSTKLKFGGGLLVECPSLSPRGIEKGEGKRQAEQNHTLPDVSILHGERVYTVYTLYSPLYLQLLFKASLGISTWYSASSRLSVSKRSMERQ
jgi:hypothetical protein